MNSCVCLLYIFALPGRFHIVFLIIFRCGRYSVANTCNFCKARETLCTATSGHFFLLLLLLNGCCLPFLFRACFSSRLERVYVCSVVDGYCTVKRRYCMLYARVSLAVSVLLHVFLNDNHHDHILHDIIVFVR